MTDQRTFKYLDLITALFAALLIVSNICSTRLVNVGGFLNFDAGTLIFPFTYILNDLTTEVYGFRRSRRVIWIGFLALVLSAAAIALVGRLDPAEGWDQAEAWDSILGLWPRLVAASLIAYLVGEFVNAYVLAKLKVKTQGRRLGLRLIASTAVGQVFDTLIFASIAFIGVIGWETWWHLVWSNYVFKVGAEILLLPLVALVVWRVKLAEGSDHYDRETRFSPFRWKD
ncbi:MAG: queuosine precursor transporter [Deltaproteobacteria bacterium]|nr:queuosine precursor transporter [Deltaproteobacteria bacterium]